MVDIKDIVPLTKKLSLLYIDEDQEFLRSIASELSKVFFSVDDANDSTVGISYAKLNTYDLIIVDSVSSIMNVNQLVKNLKSINKFQNIIITTEERSSAELVEFYKSNPNLLIHKPFDINILLDSIYTVCSKLQYDRSCVDAETTDGSAKELAKLNEDLLYERKRIGRFMANEKKMNEKIKLYEDNIHINRNIYELTRLPSKYALQTAINWSEQSLLYINIDYFDFINSIYGMGKANMLLKECAKRLNMFLPKNAELFHITADEFVILLDNPTEDQDIYLAKQIQALFKEAPIEFDEYNHYIIFSIGIDRGKGKKLFINAKSASKEAKYFGGDQTVIYAANSEYMQEQKKNLYWIGVLKKAFEDDKIFTYYQPIVDNNNPDNKHYEVLCRLRDRDNNLIDANKFVNSSKLIGLITQITRTVIDKTFKLFQENNYNFSINISMYDLREDYLIDFLEYKCKKYNISPDRIYLEIVEDMVMAKYTAMDEQVLKLKKRGYHIVIDDFSTDKSSYNRMFDLKAEFIKIDGSFIKGIDKNKTNLIMVQSIVQFAKKMGIKTMAEHIESEKEYAIVKKLGIDYSQGYLLGEPSLTL